MYTQTHVFEKRDEYTIILLYYTIYYFKLQLSCCVESVNVGGGTNSLLPDGCQIEPCNSMLPTVATGTEGVWW